MYKLLGIVNIVLIGIITSPWWLRYLGKWFFPDKKIMTTRFMKVLRVVHKVLGVCLLVIMLVHGYLALGSFQLHTGTLTGIMLVLTVIFGALFYWRKKKIFFKLHKTSALIMVLLVLIHLLFPSALYYLLG